MNFNSGEVRLDWTSGPYGTREVFGVLEVTVITHKRFMNHCHYTLYSFGRHVNVLLGSVMTLIIHDIYIELSREGLCRSSEHISVCVSHFSISRLCEMRA